MESRLNEVATIVLNGGHFKVDRVVTSKSCPIDPSSFSIKFLQRDALFKKQGEGILPLLLDDYPSQPEKK
jgi:hypothetical protein